MGEECSILLTRDEELKAAEIKAAIHKLENIVTNQQGRATIIPGEHVPEDKADSVPRRFREDGHAGVTESSAQALRSVRLIHLIHPGDQPDRREHRDSREVGLG